MRIEVGALMTGPDQTGHLRDSIIVGEPADVADFRKDAGGKDGANQGKLIKVLGNNFI